MACLFISGVCTVHGDRTTGYRRCPTGERLHIAALPKCQSCKEPVVQSRNPKRLKADGSQSWRHLGTFKVKGDDGHKAVPA